MTAQTGTRQEGAGPRVVRDGAHDFDFIIGRWDVELRRLQGPLTGSTTWTEYRGTSECRPLWDGRANIDEFRVSSAGSDSVIDGLTLRLYDADTGDWSLYWANARTGLALPPTVGRFADDGRGEFYDDEELDGRPIRVRYLWFDITDDSASFEQSFSPDGGETWEPNWISTMTRVRPAAGLPG